MEVDCKQMRLCVCSATSGTLCLECVRPYVRGSQCVCWAWMDVCASEEVSGQWPFGFTWMGFICICCWDRIKPRGRSRKHIQDTKGFLAVSVAQRENRCLHAQPFLRANDEEGDMLWWERMNVQWGEETAVSLMVLYMKRSWSLEGGIEICVPVKIENFKSYWNWRMIKCLDSFKNSGSFI